MAHSGRIKHRDRDPGSGQFDDAPVPTVNRVFKITEAERQKVAQCLRYIDDARRNLESQHNADNRTIVRGLRAAADRIFAVMNDLEETEG
jgi:hypothetical protein